LEPVAAFAVSSAVSTLADAACVVALVASVAVGVATGRDQFFPWLATARRACVVVTGSLVASSFLNAVDRWALVLACLGFLAALQAVAIGFASLAPLRAYLDRHTAAGEPIWWADFERRFGRYVARRTRRGRLRRMGDRAAAAPLVEREDDVERSEP
jgi:hypothetical protein